MLGARRPYLGEADEHIWMGPRVGQNVFPTCARRRLVVFHPVRVAAANLPRDGRAEGKARRADTPADVDSNGRDRRGLRHSLDRAGGLGFDDALAHALRCGRRADLLSSVHTAVALRPYLDGLTRTQSRVGFADRFKRQVAIMPAAVVIVLALVSFALFAMSAYMALGAKWDWTLIAGTAIFGSMTLYSVAILVAKQRANR